MEDYRNGGIEITDEISMWIEESIRQLGRQADLAREVGVKDNIVKNWRGKCEHKNRYISWAVWPRLREVFISCHCGLRRDDPNYMTREELIVLASARGDALTEKEQRVVRIMRALTEDAVNDLLEIVEFHSRKLPKKSDSADGLKEA